MAVIKNVSGYGAGCKYLVAREVDGAWWFWGAWDEFDKAHDAAVEVGGQVFPTEEVEIELAYDRHGFCVA